MLVSTMFEVITIGSVVPLVAAIIGGSIPSFIVNMLDFLYIDVASLELNNPDFFVQIVIGFIILIVLSTFFRLIAQHMMIKLTNDLGFDLTNQAYKNVLHQEYSFHVETNSSEIIAAINKVQSIMGGVISPVLQSISSAIMAFGIMLFLTILDWEIAVISFGTITITYLFISYNVRKKLDANSIIIAKAHSDRIKSINEALGNIRELILGNRQVKHYHSFLQTETYLKDCSIENAFISAAPKFFIEGIGIIILLFTAFFLTSTGLPAIEVLPTIAAFAFATQKLLPALQSVYTAWSRLSGNSKLIKDVLTFLNLPRDGKKIVRADNNEFEKLTFTNVCFRHANGFEVLKDLNIELFHSEVVGIVGETGSGKSTFVDLLSKLIFPKSGNISVVGQNGIELSECEWQKNIAYVPQNPYFLDQSILMNITLNEEQDQNDIERIQSVIKVSQLSKVIEKLELGIDTVIGERGAKLSGGQLQRIAIARALYAQKQVLIFDEATSALDNNTEKVLLSSLKKVFVNKTIILITHRLQALEVCDKIYQIQNKGIMKIK
jgi:ABC-type bacteriocin/lantibiotic exporter with double-glycine peptidase domain